MSSLGELLPFFSIPLRRRLASMAERDAVRAEEIRIRQGRPLMLCLGDGDRFVDEGGRLHGSIPPRPYFATAEDLSTSVQLMSEHSLYALDEELRHGFLTLPGGHRVGLSGRAVLEGGAVKRLKYLSGLNVRVARGRPGAADILLRRLHRSLSAPNLPNILLVSPPGAGKTTLLRDLARQVSRGIPGLRIPGRKVVLIDERSELAACRLGVPQHDVGPRTDVLDACPKPEGILMAIRSLSPDVLVTDEIGREEDVLALMEARGAGVSVMASAHARSLEQLRERPVMARILSATLFDLFVLMSRREGPGTIESVLGQSEPVLFGPPASYA